MDASQLLGMLVRALADIDPGVSAPARLCRACVEVLGAQSGALTITAAPDERLTVSTSDGMSAQIDDLEDVVGEGPRRLAVAEDRTVVVEIDRHDQAAQAFPVFSHLAEQITGPATFVAVPMRVGSKVVGVLSLYFTTGRLVHDDGDLRFLADVVGQSLVSDPESLDWSSRSRIHQATGMVTAQLRIPPADALAVLRAHAFAGSTTLATVAEEILGRRLAFVRDESDVVTTERTEDS